MPQNSKSEFRIKKGCESCRKSHLRCGGEKPFCKRCVEKVRTCTWPKPERRRKYLRHEKLPSRPRSLIPVGTPEIQITVGNLTENPANGLLSTSQDETDVDLLLASRFQISMGFDNMKSAEPRTSSVRDFSSPTSDYVDANSGSVYLDYASLPHQQYQRYLAAQLDAPCSFALSGYSMSLPNSMNLDLDVHCALWHYTSTFSIYRTTKEPMWGTHKLLLDHGAKSTMIMHFILAVAINDVCHRQGVESSLEAQDHFAAGAQELRDVIQRDSREDFITVMAGFLFLYWYMSTSSHVPRYQIQQLSIIVLSYLKKHELDCYCLEACSDEASSRERPILARLIIWIFDEDVKCGFQGYGGYLAAYLTAHRERTMAVYEVSRTALKAHFGTMYPDDQTSDDDENAMELEFLWALTALWQDINNLSPDQAASEARKHIEQRFGFLEKKYSYVFLKSASTQPRTRDTRVLINADYDVILFHALRVYYFRTNVLDSSMSDEIPTDIQAALQSMIDILNRTFASKTSDLHDRLQWPLFLAGIEIKGGICRNWILNTITSPRARAVLQQTIDHQNLSGRRLAMVVIKSLLCEGEMGLGYSVSCDQDSFLGAISRQNL